MEVINISPPNYTNIMKSNYNIDPKNFYLNWNSILEVPISFDSEKIISELKLNNDEDENMIEIPMVESDDDNTDYDIASFFDTDNNSEDNNSENNNFEHNKLNSSYNWQNYTNNSNLNFDQISIPKNKYTIFEFIKELIPDFYDNLEISYRAFYDLNYNVSLTIKDDDEIFFNNNKFLDEDIKKYIDELLKEYIPMFEQLFDDDNHVAKFLKNAIKLKANGYFKNNEYNSIFFIELVKEYAVFIPSFIGEIYYNKLIELKNTKSKDEIRQIVKQELENKKNNVKNILKKFRTDILLKAEEYDERKNNVEYHLSYGDDFENFETLTNDIIYLVIFYSKKLIKEDVYPIHLLLSDIIKKYIKIDLDNFIHINNNLTYSI